MAVINSYTPTWDKMEDLKTHHNKLNNDFSLKNIANYMFTFENGLILLGFCQGGQISQFDQFLMKLLFFHLSEVISMSKYVHLSSH